MNKLERLDEYLYDLRSIWDWPQIVTASILIQWFKIEMDKEVNKDKAMKYFNLFSSMSKLYPDCHVIATVYDVIGTYMLQEFKMESFPNVHNFNQSYKK